MAFASAHEHRRLMQKGVVVDLLDEEIRHVGGRVDPPVPTSFCTYSPVVGARSACILAASARNSPSCMVASKARRSSAALSADTPGGATNGRAMAEGPTMSSSKCCRMSEQDRTGPKGPET